MRKCCDKYDELAKHLPHVWHLYGFETLPWRNCCEWSWSSPLLFNIYTVQCIYKGSKDCMHTLHDKNVTPSANHLIFYVMADLEMFHSFFIKFLSIFAFRMLLIWLLLCSLCLSFSTTACTRIHYYSLIALAITLIYNSVMAPGFYWRPSFYWRIYDIGDWHLLEQRPLTNPPHPRCHLRLSVY